MERKVSKRSKYRPSQRITDQASRKERGFTYKPSTKRRPRQAPQRQFSRKDLIRACLEEFHLGSGGLASLYSSLLARTLADDDDELELYGRAVEEVFGVNEG